MKKILIIEDDLFIRENVYEVLELSGYEVLSAINGKDGLDLAFKHLPDLIICDIMMPVMDGYEVKKQLADNNETKNIPFIFLTARTEIKELRQGMSLGADDYITKPFEIKDLLNSINLRFEKIENIKKLYRIVNNSGSNELGKDIIVFKNENKKQSVCSKEIVLIRSKNGHTEICMADEEKFRIRKNLKYWEGILPESNFLRIQQSVIINTKYLEKIENSDDHKVYIRMKFFSEPICVGSKQINKLKELVN